MERRVVDVNFGLVASMQDWCRFVADELAGSQECRTVSGRKGTVELDGVDVLNVECAMQALVPDMLVDLQAYFRWYLEQVTSFHAEPAVGRDSHLPWLSQIRFPFWNISKSNAPSLPSQYISVMSAMSLRERNHRSYQGRARSGTGGE